MAHERYQKDLPYSRNIIKGAQPEDDDLDNQPQRSPEGEDQNDLDDIFEVPEAPIDKSDNDTGWALSGGLKLLLWGVLALACGLILANILRAYRPGQAAAAKAPAVKRRETSQRAIKVSARTKTKNKGVLDKIDQLADQGAYGDAVQMLLTLCVERVQGQFSSDMLASLTNREILERAELPGQAKSAFSTIVSAEELSQFGQRQANQKIYALCREHFDIFDKTHGEVSHGQ